MIIASLLLAAAAPPSAASPALPCAAQARVQALKLLRFHVDGDERATVDEASLRKVGTIASLTGKRRFDVLEVWGDVYKGHYRIRLIYARLPGTCALVGQEVLESTDL